MEDHKLLEVGWWWLQSVPKHWSLATPTTLVLVVIIFTTFLLKSSPKKKTKSSPSARPPPGPWKLPVIGNLHQMAVGSPLTHHRLRDLARQYGPLMQLKLGELSAVVVSSPKWAKQFMQTHDLNFATRPFLLAASIIFYDGRDIAFAPHGDYWRKMRKVVSMELLGARRVKLFRPIMEREVKKLVESISAGGTAAPVNMSRMFVSLGTTVTSCVAFGKARKDDHQVELLLPLIDQIMETLGGFSLVDLFPSSKLVGLLTGAHSSLRKVHAAVDVILEAIISDHAARRSTSSSATNSKKDGDGEDVVDVLLSIKENNDLGIPFTNEEIKALILQIFLGGTDTWTVAVEWAMSELMKNPWVMKKAQEEVRQVFNSKEKMDQLPYLQLVVKETFRLHPPGPLLVPRESRETVEIDGYQIPATTKVIINAWAIGRDPQHWTEPETFHPERFLDSSVDFKGMDFQLIPFGAGRRACPGIHYGISIINIVLANLLYHFDWELPDGITHQDFDMSEKFGVEVTRKNDLLLVPVPYIPHHPE
ncbi:unnamed protein product [Linum tenue]|uniref:Cytochrome P450 n=5 Tax=Linum tenue TaxID=586396 RepID=A0AAV0NA31_9ROSI|nr:unnamed protein product [Linum tenue]